MRKRKVKKMPVFVFLIIIIGIILSVVYLIKPDSDVEKKESKGKKSNNEVSKKVETKKMSLVAVGDCLIHGAVYIDARVGNNSYDFSGMIENIKPLISAYKAPTCTQDGNIAYCYCFNIIINYWW